MDAIAATVRWSCHELSVDFAAIDTMPIACSRCHGRSSTSCTGCSWVPPIRFPACREERWH